MKKIPVSTLFLLLPFICLARQDITLNGEWLFRTPDTAEQTVTVPHTYNVMDGLEDYAGKAFYRRRLPLSPDMAGSRVRLHFNAVYHDATVYVNGTKVGEHLDAGYSPFSFDVTPYLDFNSSNELLVECRTGRVVFDGRQTLEKGQNGNYSFPVDCGKVQLWHFDDPALYSYEAVLWNRKKVSDTRSERFGFRRIELSGNRFVLNGEPVRLPGIENMPGSNPDFGMAESHGYIEVLNSTSAAQTEV